VGVPSANCAPSLPPLRLGFGFHVRSP